MRSLTSLALPLDRSRQRVLVRWQWRREWLTRASGPGRYDAVPVTSNKTVTGLEGPVDVVRDKYGMVHIHATSFVDAVRVQGYQVARDRTAQLELIRRTATGRLAEILGDAAPTLIDDDIAMRTVASRAPARPCSICSRRSAQLARGVRRRDLAVQRAPRDR